jgi:hypothetical protein
VLSDPMMRGWPARPVRHGDNVHRTMALTRRPKYWYSQIYELAEWPGRGCLVSIGVRLVCRPAYTNGHPAAIDLRKIIVG